MPIEHIEQLDDPRLTPYRSLKRTNLTRWSGLMIAEGERVVRRLLASSFVTRSILLSERKAHLAEDPLFARQSVLILPQDQAELLVGYRFHAGVLACGERRPSQRLSETLATGRLEPADASSTKVVVVCPRMTDPDNLGTLIRLCSGFGAGPLILGPGSCDPFARRVSRVSMGYAFSLPIIESTDLSIDLTVLRDSGFVLAATVLDPGVVPLHRTSRSGRIALLFGNEADGLDPQWIQRCDFQLTIPMSGGTDSLNVSLAAGIMLHHFLRSVQDDHPLE